ncbi:MAG: hypothetical protein DRH23_01175 [Deltaproteobacteria bacterium]|nr:energy transducer TonB [Deltaproteobacteria bacterium]MBW2190904.1 energy transducer TonB [Deltaproteobacteria bacterium]MBW2223994.1 energy transducer TonB [Deltaproteobacteria bacterium]MBW2403425.1 energy transducer TonB [Deltaproteobacteria bacterium]MBW2547864.1 energy transducer TonB [Deltaproteobacteria bacterium]
MTPGSSLPPLQKNDGKYGLIALLLLLAAGGVWFFFKTDDPPPQAEAAEPVAEAPTRAQFAAEIEIPDEDAGLEDADEAPPPSKPGRSSQTRPEDWVCRGNLDAGELTAVLKGQPSKQVQTCYERGLKDNNLLQGSMTVLLTIGAHGSVRAVSVDGTLRDRQVYACVKRVARTWKFPKPSDGCVRTSVPFQMMPKL